MNAEQQKFYAELHRKACGYGRLAKYRDNKQALKWLEDNYTGDSRKAFRWKMNAPSSQLTVAFKLRQIYRVSLGLA